MAGPARKDEDLESFMSPDVEAEEKASERGSGDDDAWSCCEHSQVVVVGGGVAGLVAAYSVLESGGRATLLEWKPRCGGSHAKTVNGICATGTRAQSRRGVVDSVDAFVADSTRGGSGQVELARALCESSGKDLDWLLDHLGLELPVLDCCGGHSAPRTHHSEDMDTGGLLARALLKALEKTGKETGRVRIVTKARVTRLLTDGVGACCGCVYTSDGVERRELGPVVLCTGGFAGGTAEDSPMALHRPDLLHLPVAGGSGGCAGDGLRMAGALGARTAGLEWIHVHPTGLVERPSDSATLVAADALREAGGLILNKEGDRVCDELASDEEIVCEMWKKRSRFRLVLNAAAAKDVMPLCEAYQELGLMEFFPNGAALAKDMGVLLSTLESKFEAHHQAADKDVDAGLDVGSAAGSASPPRTCRRNAIPGAAVAAEPFYVATVTPVVLCCCGGLQTGADGAVAGANSSPIRGLYAAGEVASSACGASDFGGTALLECLVFGRAAGRAAAECAFTGGVGDPVEDSALASAAVESPGAARVPEAPDAPGGTDGPAACEDLQGDARGFQKQVSDARLVAAGPLEKFLESRLTAEALQAALAAAHMHGGDLEAVRSALRNTILAKADEEQGKPYLQMSLRDVGGLPGAVKYVPLPEFDGAFDKVPISCVHCRSPLSLNIGRRADGTNCNYDPTEEGAHAYATLLYGNKIEYFLGALVIGWSLKATGTEKDLLLLHTNDVPAPYLKVLSRHWILFEVQYLEGSPKLYKNYNSSRFKNVFTKLQALSCLDYSKVLMLDNDMLVRRSLDELFLLRAPAALKRSSGKEQPEHGGTYGAQDLWRSQCDDMCSGINAGVMLLEPNQHIYERMLQEIEDPWHPEHIGTYGPEQDYLARFYCTFLDGQWRHIHAKFNYQLMLPDDYCSSAHKALDIERDVVVAHYSGPRVKPWKLDGDLDVAGATRLLHDDSVREIFGRDPWAGQREQRGGHRPQQPRERVMDGVLVTEDKGQGKLPEKVQSVMWEWVLALRKCAACMKEEGVDILSILREVQSSAH